MQKQFLGLGQRTFGLALWDRLQRLPSENASAQFRGSLTKCSSQKFVCDICTQLIANIGHEDQEIIKC